MAALHGRIEVVEFLVDKGADISAKDKIQVGTCKTEVGWWRGGLMWVMMKGCVEMYMHNQYILVL